MAKDIKEQSTAELKRKIKIGKIILSVCWTAVFVTIAFALCYGKTPFTLGSSSGFLGLFVATIAMWAGWKKIKEELARRND